MDSGVRDKTAVLFAYYDFKQAKLFVQREFWLSGETVRTDHIASRVKALELELEYDKVYRRMADCNNLVLVNDLNSVYKLNFYPTTKDSLEAMINKVRIWIGDGRISIDPSCKELIGCLENGIWNKNRDDFGRSKVYGHFDALAALQYLVRNIDTMTNPIPRMHNKSIYTHSVGPEDFMPTDISVVWRPKKERLPEGYGENTNGQRQ